MTMVLTMGMAYEMEKMVLVFASLNVQHNKWHVVCLPYTHLQVGKKEVRELGRPASHRAVVYRFSNLSWRDGNTLLGDTCVTSISESSLLIS